VQTAGNDGSELVIFALGVAVSHDLCRRSLGYAHQPVPNGEGLRQNLAGGLGGHVELGIMSRSASRRLGQIAAYLAAPLWALQAPIWMAAPKVQEQTVPYRITNPVLFELFWLSIAGAVAFSAAAARPITRQVGVPVSRLSRTSAAVAVLALALATAATVCIALAPIPALQPVAITVMTNLLNGAAVSLAVSLTLSAIACWQIRGTAGRVAAFPAALAVVTIAMIVAILASSSQSMISLSFAVVVAVLNGIIWFGWARAISGTLGRQQYSTANY
jgi:hypothetical protein